MTTHPITELTIIGGGPTGLFARFYAGMRGIGAQIIDALPQMGGQLTAMYPEKYIFDVGGFTRVLAKDLVRVLAEQASQWGGTDFLNTRVEGLGQEDGHFVLVTDRGLFPARAIVVAAGLGAFAARRLPQAVAASWYGRGIHDVVTDPEAFRGRRVVIIGGGDSAFDWADQLRGRAERVSLVHRSDRYRAHASTVEAVRQAAAAGGTDLWPFHELHDVMGEGDRLTGIVLRNSKSRQLKAVPCDAVLPMLGYKPDLGDLVNWGLAIRNDEIEVNSLMETGRPGVWAAGDVTAYPGKLKLIATGFAEAAAAVNQAAHWLHPEKKVEPGHSSNLAIFGQSPD